MSWVELSIFALLIAGLALGGLASRRISVGPSGHWITGWVVLLAVGILNGIPRFAFTTRT